MASIGEGARNRLGQIGYDVLAGALAGCERERFSGALRVSGSPGGAFHFRNGLVVAVESPGAPGPDALLLRSGRISAEQWAELVRQSGGSSWPADALAAHGLAGAAQLRLVCALALRDAAFAVVAGRIGAFERVDGVAPRAPLAVGEPPGRVLEEAVRRLAAVVALPYPVRPERERPVPAQLSRAGYRLGMLQRELLTYADGRRTARDLAFRTGRAVYAVTVEVARMLGEGLLECPDAPQSIPVRLPPGGQGVRPRDPAPPPVLPRQPAGPSVLPRRRPGASGITEALRPRRVAGPALVDAAGPPARNPGVPGEGAPVEPGVPVESAVPLESGVPVESGSPGVLVGPGVPGVLTDPVGDESDVLAERRTGASWKEFFRLRNTTAQ
ncbi:DUF4388 domain-containing protein [Streptomyces actuosus]|uniref:DUF4388 domain-containing protein n=1 Tax=Streptomyces actuosus TaxID=1885 RepID=UPI0027D9F11D|nr:DUF4388 domain-containing protein [Streptomyces actuosus]